MMAREIGSNGMTHLKSALLLFALVGVNCNRRLSVVVIRIFDSRARLFLLSLRTCSTVARARLTPLLFDIRVTFFGAY
jgi:hypothetical protein